MGGSGVKDSRFRRPIMRQKADAVKADDRRQWFRIENNLGQPGVACIYIYDEIGYWGVTASDFVMALQAVNATQLEVHLNSPGGDVYDGIAIYQALVSHPANVIMYVDSLAASAASFIAMAGDEIEISPFGTMMIHDAHGLCIGNAADMAAFAENLDAASQNIANVYAARTGGDAADWRTAMQAETWYYGQDAVDAGLADRVGPAKEGDTAEGVDQAIAARWDLQIFAHTPDRLRMQSGGEGGELLPPPVRGRHRVAAKAPEIAAEAPQAPAEGDVPRPQMTASPVHHTATEDRPWDEGPNMKRLPSPMMLKTVKGMFAYYDDSAVEDGKCAKDACKLPHHEVSSDGTPGAANLNACRNALSRLPGSDIPADEHDAIKRHLNAHLDDARGSDGGDDTANNARVTSDLTAGSDNSGTVKDEAIVPEVDEPALDFESIRAALRGARK